jgi:hypothetical protein
MVRLEGLGKLKKTNDLIRIQTHDLPACSTVPQPTTLPGAPRFWKCIYWVTQHQMSWVVTPKLSMWYLTGNWILITLKWSQNELPILITTIVI